MNAMLQPRFAPKVHTHARAARPWYFEREAETMARGAMRASSVNTPFGSRVACKVWLRMTKSKASAG